MRSSSVYLFWTFASRIKQFYAATIVGVWYRLSRADATAVLLPIDGRQYCNAAVNKQQAVRSAVITYHNMSHILRRLGDAALKFRDVGPNKYLPPILSRRRALVLRKEWLAQGKEWPYEQIVPGIPKNDPPYHGGKQKGHKRYLSQEERQQKINAAMAKMPQLIADYRASRRTPWESVTPADKLLLTRKQIREKYVYRKLK